MFNAKPYSAVNREERFFCALTAHALLSSEVFRARFLLVIDQRLGVQIDPEQLQVYLETAALRDYWSDLGDSHVYDRATHERRRAVLNTVLMLVGVDPAVIDSNALFWTSGVGSKLWSPGRWSLRDLQQSGLAQLVQVRWAFNAKPDMLLLSPSAGVLIEAKVESGLGRIDKTGYEQLNTQRFIVDLWQKLIPSFSLPIRLTTLTLQRAGDDRLAWSDVLAAMKDSDVDDFTQTCFRRLVTADKTY